MSAPPVLTDSLARPAALSITAAASRTTLQEDLESAASRSTCVEDLGSRTHDFVSRSSHTPSVMPLPTAGCPLEDATGARANRCLLLIANAGHTFSLSRSSAVWRESTVKSEETHKQKCGPIRLLEQKGRRRSRQRVLETVDVGDRCGRSLRAEPHLMPAMRPSSAAVAYSAVKDQLVSLSLEIEVRERITGEFM